MFKYLRDGIFSFTIVFITCITIAIVTGAVGYTSKHQNDVYKQVNVLLEECEAKLPRDKHCKIIAVEDKQYAN